MEKRGPSSSRGARGCGGKGVLEAGFGPQGSREAPAHRRPMFLCLSIFRKQPVHLGHFPPHCEPALGRGSVFHTHRYFGAGVRDAESHGRCSSLPHGIWEGGCRGRGCVQEWKKPEGSGLGKFQKRWRQCLGKLESLHPRLLATRGQSQDLTSTLVCPLVPSLMTG